MECERCHGDKEISSCLKTPWADIRISLCEECMREYQYKWHAMWIMFITELDIEKALKDK